MSRSQVFSFRSLTPARFHTTSNRFASSYRKMGEHILDRYQLQPLRSDSVPWRRQPGQQVLWIGCSDSGCDELESLGLPSDEVFEYRSLGNMMVDDLSCNTALRYALDSLKVSSLFLGEGATNISQIRNIVICGHYGCHIASGEVETTLQKPWSR
jgi:carbonic anhydrase